MRCVVLLTGLACMSFRGKGILTRCVSGLRRRRKERGSKLTFIGTRSRRIIYYSHKLHNRKVVLNRLSLTDNREATMNRSSLIDNRNLNIG